MHIQIQAIRGLMLVTIFFLFGIAASAAPYAALVMDARTGEVIHARNADTRLHPASLTKMMTLYLAFQAIESGKISLDQKVKISANAAAEPPSKLGLVKGQKIAFRYLVRAAAVKSANDAATAIGETIAGSEAKFAALMTSTAKKMGMKRTTFKNAHGLTKSGHMSTARDMTLLGRRLFYDYPEYYHLFSRITVDAGVRQVSNTNRRLLSNYKGADGIKTGFTNAAGFNLVSSAKRGNKRIIATVFGGRSTASRNARIAELLDMGFKKAPNRVATNKPRALKAAPSGKSFVLKAPRAVVQSPFPKTRPNVVVARAQAADALAIEQSIMAAVSEQPTVQTQKVALVAATDSNIIQASYAPEIRPKRRTELLIVARDTGPRKWSVQLGALSSRYKAEKLLLRTALADLRALDGALRKINPTKVQGQTRYQARFVGLSQADANKACARLRARSVECTPVSPGT